MGQLIRLSLIAVMVLTISSVHSQPVECQTDSSLCGRNSQCVDGLCVCDEGYSSQDGSDCLHDLCNVEGCFECLDVTKCSRCKDIVVQGSGECITECPHQESLQFHGDFVGRVCTYPAQTQNLPTVYTAIIGVICAGIIIALIIGLACFIHQRRTQGNFDFLYGKPNRHKVNVPADDNVINQKYQRDPGSVDNTGSAASELPIKVDQQKTNPVLGNRIEFLRQVSELKPHAETFLKMLNDVRKRYRGLKHGNPRAGSYKAVMRDLSRVLFILNKKETSLKMPPDGNELLKWAARILKNYENCQSSETETDNNQKAGKKTVTDIPGGVWIESKDETSALYKDLGYVESKLI
ncbi:uncharacterized protein [Ptychodera flava]|uniref:uncharacterized protein isoform X2 n=1 Tax=Ptychodera flava TaxID=63121 RepID=UPI00396A8427